MKLLLVAGQFHTPDAIVAAIRDNLGVNESTNKNRPDSPAPALAVGGGGCGVSLCVHSRLVGSGTRVLEPEQHTRTPPLP